MHLWFLPVCLLLIALIALILLLAAHRRWGLAIPVAMAAGAAGVAARVLGPHLHLIGFADYLLVGGRCTSGGSPGTTAPSPGRDGAPGLSPLRGAAALAALTGLGPIPVDMIGAGERMGNTTPPSRPGCCSRPSPRWPGRARGGAWPASTRPS